MIEVNSKIGYKTFKGSNFNVNLIDSEFDAVIDTVFPPKNKIKESDDYFFIPINRYTNIGKNNKKNYFLIFKYLKYLKIKMDHINFFLQEVEKSRRQIPDNVSAEEYMKFASTNYMMLHYLCQQHSIDFYPLVSKQEFFIECVKKRKEELKEEEKKESLGKSKGKKVKNRIPVENKEPKIKLVIFDKDGTLVHNNFLFQEYCTKVIETFRDDVDDVQKFGEKLGFDVKENKFIPGGLMSMASGPQMCQKIVSILGNKYTLLQVEEKLSRIETTEETTIVEFTDTKELFTSLKRKGIKIGVCTSDDRRNALNHLARIGVLEMVDYLKCGMIIK